MPARRKKQPDLGHYEELVACVRRVAREAEALERTIVQVLNSAYIPGATDARKALAGRDRKGEGGENDA